MSSLSLDQIGHAPSGPERSPVAQSLRTFFQAFFELLQLERLEAWLAPSACGFAKGLVALSFPSLMPATDRLAVHSQLPGHFALLDAFVKQLGGFDPPPFQFVEIAFNAFGITHARSLP